MARFKGKPPGSGSGEMSKRTEALRPALLLGPKQVTEARRLRRLGLEPSAIAERMSMPLEEIEKALLQMRSPRPETTRGTLNVTLAAHRLIMQERDGNEPIWVTMDRMMDELLRHRADAAQREAAEKRRVASRRKIEDSTWSLPLSLGSASPHE